MPELPSEAFPHHYITDRRKYELELLRAKNLADRQREQLALANEELKAKKPLAARGEAEALDNNREIGDC